MKTLAKGIYRVLGEAGGYGLLVIALLANLCEGYARAKIASEGGKMLDAAVARNSGGMVNFFLVILAFIVLLAAGIFVKDSLLGQYLEKGMLRLRKKTIKSLGDAEMSWLDGHHTGKLSARVMADLNALSGALRPVLIMGISVAIYQCVGITFMFMANWRLTLIVFAFVPVTTILQWLSSHPIRKYRKTNQEAVGLLSSVVFDCFGSFESVKSLNLEEEMTRRFNNAQEKQVTAILNETRVVAALTLFSGLGRYLPYLALLLAGGSFVIHESMTLGQLTMFIALSSSVLSVIGDMGSLIASIRQLGVNADRIVELWDSPSEQKPGTNKLDSYDGNALCFDRVSFCYTQKENIISDISFTVTPGTFIALVGESGCGKSTVMKLAASLYTPQDGSVRIFGRDISGWDLNSLRSRVAYVTQDTYLFPGSLRDNICAGGITNHENEALLEACIEAAQLSAFVKSLPEGLDTDAGERGVFLSGGQRQRISIARALYKKAELLFLDEATSGLDRSTEEAVLRGIMNMKTPTLVAITHSLANVRNADQIIVLKDGRIAETGTHESLLSKQGEYCRLIARQREEVSF